MDCGEAEICKENTEILIEKHFPYIVKTVSRLTGRYVSAESDEEFSIALSAFAEAVERYKSSRGAFLPFAGLVIRSRLLNYYEREKSYGELLSLEALAESGRELSDGSYEQTELREEIEVWEQELKSFGLSLEAMADCAPKHSDTRENAVVIAEKASQDTHIVSESYRKHRLPVRAVARLCSVTEKIVKTSKSFILGTMLVFVLRLSSLTGWIRKTR